MLPTVKSCNPPVPDLPTSCLVRLHRAYNVAQVVWLGNWVRILAPRRAVSPSITSLLLGDGAIANPDSGVSSRLLFSRNTAEKLVGPRKPEEPPNRGSGVGAVSDALEAGVSPLGAGAWELGGVLESGAVWLTSLGARRVCVMPAPLYTQLDAMLRRTHRLHVSSVLSQASFLFRHGLVIAE